MQRMCLIVGACLFFSFPVLAKALAEPAGVAVLLPVLGEEVPDGSLVCSSSEGFRMCAEAYDGRMFGVIDDSPPAFFETISDASGSARPILSQGRVQVRVSDANGAIEVGDLLTSSTTPGVAQKATENGYVLGTALEAFEREEGAVAVVLQIRPEVRLANARTNLMEVLLSGTEAPIFQPLDSLRYVLAALLVLVSFTLGFVYYGRMAKATVEAIGRNPLAKTQISLGVLVHFVVTAGVILLGFGAAYLVLIL